MPRHPLPRPSRLIAAPLLRAQSDDRLVELVRDGHDPAFTVVVQRYRGPLERYVARIVGPSRAEDAVQQAFANAHRALVHDGRSVELKPWLYRIAHNAAVNQLRGAPADVADPDDPRAATAESATAAAAADVAALRARLRETLDAVAALPAPQRDAVVLREFEGRSHAEIAMALGVSTGAARQHLARARSSLRAAVSAVTPYPLIAKLAVLGSGSSAAGSAAELVVGAGAGATFVKLGAGLAAGGALLGTVGLPAPGPAASVEERTVSRRVDTGAAVQQPAARSAPTTGAPRPAAAGAARPAVTIRGTGRPSSVGRAGSGRVAPSDTRRPRAPRALPAADEPAVAPPSPSAVTDAERPGALAPVALRPPSSGQGPGGSGSGISVDDEDDRPSQADAPVAAEDDSSGPGSGPSASGASDSGSSGSGSSGSDDDHRETADETHEEDDTGED